MLVVLLVAIAVFVVGYSFAQILEHGPTAEELWPDVPKTDGGWDHPVNCKCLLYHN